MGNEQIKVIIVLRGRIKGKKGEKVSESWKKISEGAVVKAEELNISLKVFSPKSYHDDDEFLLLVARAVKENPDVLIIPFTLAEKMTETLQGFSGKIVAINVPPTKEIRKNLPNFVGYVGMDQEEAGRLAAEKLLSHDRRINKFVVLTGGYCSGGIISARYIASTHYFCQFYFVLAECGIHEYICQDRQACIDIFFQNRHGSGA